MCFRHWMRLQTAPALSVVNSELDVSEVPRAFWGAWGGNVTIPPQHSMHTDKCHLTYYDKQKSNLQIWAQWAEQGVKASAQAPAHCTTCFTKQEPSHPLHTAHDPITLEPWTSLLWSYQGVKTQTLQFTTFLATIIPALNLLLRGLLQSWQDLGVTKKSHQLQHAEWCRGNHHLNHTTEFSQKTQACCKLSS